MAANQGPIFIFCQTGPDSSHWASCTIRLQVHVAYDEPWPRRDVLGVHAQKQPGLFWVGACCPVGRLVASDLFAMADIADRWA
jgi:ferredoxin-nitrite reductase